MHSHRIVGVHITNRVKNAPEVQAILTEYGCSIKTRLGLHETSDQSCSPHGLLLMELAGDETRCQELVTRLKNVTGLDVQEMHFKV